MVAAKVKTLDGRRTPVQSINTEVPAALQTDSSGILPAIGRIWKSLNLLMAGMYTGVGCSGTPHEDHSYQKSGKPKA